MRARRGRRSPPPWLLLLLLATVLAPALPAWAQEPRPVVAVLPFRVHSAKPIDYLGESVASLLQKQLAERPSLQVLPRESLRAALGDAPAPTADEQLRRQAQTLGASFLVSGSLTELAGRYSLDVRVTPAALGTAPQTSVLTAQDDEELLQAVGELAERIARHVLGAAPRRVTRVELDGAGPREASLRSQLSTRSGELYDPGSVRDDLAALRADPQLASVEVETEVADDGLVVRFLVVTSGRLQPATQVPSGALVAELQVRGNRRIEADAIRARIGTAPGQPYQPEQIARDIRQIHALSFFRDVRVLTEQAPGGVVVIFEVVENPVVRQISISGNENIDGDKIRDVLTLTTGTTLDYPLLFENRGRIRALYRAEGYYLAEVAHEVEDISEGSVGIHFIVNEDEKLKLRKVEFVGNEHFSDRELRDGFRTKTWRFWSYATSWFDKSGTYSEPLFAQDLRGVEKKYGDAGYLQASVGEPRVEATKDGILVTVPITEGPRFTVGVVEISGDERADLSALREELELREGDIFSRSLLNEDVTRLRDHYTNRGFFYATVEPAFSNITEDTRAVDVDFRVRRGPLYFIRQVDIAGNTATVDPVIRREIPLVEGELYSQRKIDIARRRIQGLGFFEEVDLRVEPTADPQLLDLEVSVVEKPTGSFSFGAGFSSQDNFLLNASLSQSNLFGRGYAVALDANVGRESQRFFFSFADPAILGTDFSLRGTVYNTRVRFESFDQTAIGTDWVLGHSLAEDGRTRGALRYSFASAEVDQSSQINAAALIFREVFQSSVATSLAGLSFNRDHRNDRLTPTDGSVVGAALEFAGLGFFSRFLRMELRGARYFPMPDLWVVENTTFVVSSRVGWALPLNSIGDFEFPFVSAADQMAADTCNAGPDGTQCLALDQIDRDLKLPLAERYFLGGIGQYQLRGFKARSLGPRRPILEPVFGNPSIFAPFGRGGGFDAMGNPVAVGECRFGQDASGRDRCNDVQARELGQYNVPQQTDVIGGNKFISTSFEYRFPIAESFGLQGIAFFDMGNAFEEGDPLYDVREWRYGTGGAVQWFSPFGPIMFVLGFPVDRVAELEDSPVFEFSVGGG